MENALEKEKRDDRETSSGAFVTAQAGDAVAWASPVVLAVSMNWRL